MSIIEKAMRRRGSLQASERLSPNVIRKVIRQHPANGEGLEKGTVVLRKPTAVTSTRDEKPSHRLPAAHLQADSTIISNKPTPQTAEEYRQVKRPLLASAFGRGAPQVQRGSLIMITSALPDEGKTAVAINLAFSIALERNHTVLLVDADMTKHGVSRLYGLEDSLGLTDILLDDDLNLNDLLTPSDFPSLNILPAGGGHAHVVELFASNKMEALMAELVDANPNRVIIMDCPPMLGTNESQVLVRLVGQIVVVVEAGETPQHVVQDAIATLDASKPINLILNKSRRSRSAGYYGYGKHGYGSE